MKEDDHAYFRRRAAEERVMAERAEHPLVRNLHLELADRYEKAARSSVALRAKEGGHGQVIEGAIARPN